MRTLLVLSNRKIHRLENAEIYKALSTKIPDLVWCTGSAFDLARTVSKGYMYLDQVDAAALDDNPKATKFSLDAFDVAIVDQSLDLTQDQSPSAFDGVGLASRSLDFQGRERPSELVDDFTRLGVVCIGTSRGGVCLDELAQFGAVMTCKLEEVVHHLPTFLAEAQRLVSANQDDNKLKALTLRQPFAWSVFNAGKDVENRTWPCKVRGTIAIHAAYNQPEGVYAPSSKFIQSVLKKLGKKSVRIPSLAKLDRGAIIGLVDIVDCVDGSPSAWFEGPIGFVFANARLLPKPVPCADKRRFFTLSDEVERLVRASDPHHQK
ncbi:MAG: ASCH domain-containing protein [Candidatus Obscuribacterales bacterium]|nr:ASCH domain-containing protein [Candidatus Obscuribacterales bacterium]